MHTRKEQMEAFGRFLDILDELREKCPWDRKQTNESLRPNTIEETYELCDALMKDDKKWEADFPSSSCFWRSESRDCREGD